MVGEHKQAEARRVVAGLDRDDRSAIVSDGLTTARAVTDAFTICQIWQIGSIPPHVLGENTLGEEASFPPPPTGFTYIKVTFPPDNERDMASGYADALEAAGGAVSRIEDESIAGLHQTDTVDIITVISGEIYAVLEKSETLLRSGDSFVQRGTKHTWSNRSDKPCAIVAVMMSATR